jgi:hypothetical protein
LIAHEPNDEGFGYAAVLYECERTRTLFYHSQADPQYYGPPNEKIIQINANGEFKVRRVHPVHATCPKCGAKDFEKQGKSMEEFIEAVPLYKMGTLQVVPPNGPQALQYHSIFTSIAPVGAL